METMDQYFKKANDLVTRKVSYKILFDFGAP
jgi:hypothetical protein